MKERRTAWATRSASSSTKDAISVWTQLTKIDPAVDGTDHVMVNLLI
jgi:hypothetical protein